MDKETSALLSSLNDQRNHVLGILGLPDLDGDRHMEGLPGDALRRPVLPSGWSCLGMVKHLTVSDERFWFRGIVAGIPPVSAHLTRPPRRPGRLLRIFRPMPYSMPTGRRSNSPTPSSPPRR
jgi:Protein of unknown function (DUF664)